MKTLGELLKKGRSASGLSQKDVADKLGYSSSQFISNWERNISMPPANTLKKLSGLYDLPTDLLLNAVSTNAANIARKKYAEKFERAQ